MLASAANGTFASDASAHLSHTAEWQTDNLALLTELRKLFKQLSVSQRHL